MAMQTRLVAAGLLLAIVASVPAFGQNREPRADVFAGYSLLPADGNDFPRQTSHGVQVSVSANLNRWFGLVADLGAQYRTVTDLGPGFRGVVAKTSVYEYLAGPRFTARQAAFDIFAHSLIGGATGHSGIRGFSDSALTFGFGGGVDVHLNRTAAIRAQVDYLGSFVDILEDNMRVGVGATVSFGR